MKQWTVADVMTQNVVSVAPDASYREVVDALIEHSVSAAPVVDGQGHVAGVVSEADLLHKIEATGEPDRRRIVRVSRRATAKAHAATAADLMTTPAITVEPGTSVTAAARRMEHNGVKRMPVVDAAGRMVGIVSRRDLLRMHTRSDQDIRDDVVDGVLMRTLWIDPAAVTVGVEQGTVTLSGKLDNQSLTRIAVDMTAEVAGVVAFLMGNDGAYVTRQVISVNGGMF